MEPLIVLTPQNYSGYSFFEYNYASVILHDALERLSLFGMTSDENFYLFQCNIPEYSESNFVLSVPKKEIEEEYLNDYCMLCCILQSYILEHHLITAENYDPPYNRANF